MYYCASDVCLLSAFELKKSTSYLYHFQRSVYWSVYCTVQLHTMSSPKIALRFGSLLFNDLEQVAGKVKGYTGVTAGTMTPAARFPNSGVPECMRYVISKSLLQHEVTASQSELDEMYAARQARKRPRLTE
jgi:hypothetical protein